MEELKDKQIAKSPEQYLDYLNKKWQKISAALYTVTGHIKDMEQIKWNIRSRALEIMSFMHEIVVSQFEERLSLIDQCLRELTLLAAEHTLARQAGIIGQMNYELIHVEIEKIHTEIVDIRNKDLVVSPIQRDLIEVKAPVIKDIKESMSFTGKEKNIPKAQPAPKGQAIDGEKKVRRNIIISLLKKSDNLNIKDFAVAIKNCSEKTIQRELIGMVSEGVLYKRGHRRWSTYSLKKDL